MDAPKIPKELQDKISDAIQELCMYIHDNVGSSQVILNIQHVSDALYRSGSTSISILGGGVKVERDGEKRVDPNNKKEVDDLVANLMAKAKAKAAEKAEEKKPEDPK